MPTRTSDPAHVQTDKMLSEIEQRISVEYKQAEREITKKLNDHMARFQTKDAIWQRWVSEGKKTPDEYNNWRVGQLAIGDRWEEMRQSIAQDLMNTDKIAKSIAYGYMPDVYALNHDYGTFQVEHGSGYDTSYTLYSREAAERIFRDNPQMLPSPGRRISQKIADGKAMRWNNQNIQSVMMQGILQGNSVSDIATRLANTVGPSFTEEDIRNRDRKTAEQIAKELARKNRQAAVRNARTMVTAAQNAGRIDSYKRANQLGIKTRKQWLATLDGATRHAHRQLDGEREEVDDPFVNEFGRIMYPGDPAAAPANVYNCRCTLIAAIAGHEIDASDMSIRKNDKLNGMSYDDWKKEKQSKSRPILAQEERGDAIRAGYIRDYRGYGGDVPSGRDTTLGIDAMNGPSVGGGVVNGKDISQTWNRREGQFDFEIEDVINAQGFDGKPRVVSRSEFERAVKESNGGKGFIAQRSYSAPDKETLDAYRDQLYNGKWYVDCSTGGAQYGQGMYCAADYTGNLSEGIKNEMMHYRALGESRYETYFDGGAAREKKFAMAEAEGKKLVAQGRSMQEARAAYDKIMNMPDREWAEKYAPELLPSRGISYTETLTLSPDAKVISYRELNDIRMGNLDMSYRTQQIERIVSERGLTEDESTFVRYNLGTGVSWGDVDSAARRLTPGRRDELVDMFYDIGEEATQIYNEEHDRRISLARGYQEKYHDLGSLAASLGYDAINSEGHGQSGSYTVILNRTKVIFLGE